MKTQNKHNKLGFTLIELLVVLLIMGVLTIVVVFSSKSIAKRTAEISLKTDLDNASAQLAVEYFAKKIYPSTESLVNNGNGLTKSDSTAYDYQATDVWYCLSASHSTADSTIFHISSIDNVIKSGPCPYRFFNITSGRIHSCAISSDKKAYCWGGNNYGQLGNNSTTPSNSPVAVDTSGVLSGKSIVSISAQNNSTCALASDAKVYCWGNGLNGQLGNNLADNSYIPVAVNFGGVLSGKTVLSLSSGNDSACVIASDNNAYCWGANSRGQLGNNDTTTGYVPVAVDNSGVLKDKSILAISNGDESACVIASDHNAYCWGANDYGELGDNSIEQRNVPVAVNNSGVFSGKTIKFISVGLFSTCAIASDDKAYCWGRGSQAGLGRGNLVDSYVPTAVSDSGVLSGKKISSISVGYHVCVTDFDGKAYCWGINGSGQLGNNSTSHSLTPVAVNTSGALSDKVVSSVTTGMSYIYRTCASTTAGSYHCWGKGDDGGLGDGLGVTSLVPVTVSMP